MCLWKLWCHRPGILMQIQSLFHPPLVVSSVHCKHDFCVQYESDGQRMSCGRSVGVPSATQTGSLVWLWVYCLHIACKLFVTPVICLVIQSLLSALLTGWPSASCFAQLNSNVFKVNTGMFFPVCPDVPFFTYSLAVSGLFLHWTIISKFTVCF